MQSHEIDYQIHGDDLQFVEIELDPGEVVIAEAGAMMYIEQGITFEKILYTTAAVAMLALLAASLILDRTASRSEQTSAA